MGVPWDSLFNLGNWNDPVILQATHVLVSNRAFPPPMTFAAASQCLIPIAIYMFQDVPTVLLVR